MVWHGNSLGLMVEHVHACLLEGSGSGFELCRVSKSLIRDFDFSAQEEKDITLKPCFFLLTIFFRFL